jgi:hypothetical protein
MSPRFFRPAPLALLALALGGCGFSDPYQSTTASSATARSSTTGARDTRTTGDRRDPPPERGGTIPRAAQGAQRKLVAGAGRSSQQAALERYAAVYLNWDAVHVIALQRELASISLGQARAQALQAAASAGRDRQLTDSKVSNRGQVIAIASGHATAAGQWVIVTSEQTSGQSAYQGLPATLHIIYAQLARTSQGWVVSEWQPQN